jgi:SAM-dependent methyltransferase
LLFLSPRPGEANRLELMRGMVPHSLQPYTAKTANYGIVTSFRSALFQERLQLLEGLERAAGHRGQRSLLDIGASSGTLVREARLRGWEAHGVEPSDEGTRAAREDGIALLRGLAETLPIADGAFDVAHSHHVFEHLADPLLAAREAWRVLRPGGLVFVEVPNQFDNILFHRDMLLRRVPQRARNIRSIHHLWFFSRRTLALLLERAGFLGVRVRDQYGARRSGWRLPVAVAMQTAGRFAYGGPLIQAWARKPIGFE